MEAALVLASHPTLGVKNFKDLSLWVKAQKAPPTYSSYSPGLPQLITTVWFGLSGPKNLPAAITKRLTATHQKMSASLEFKASMASSGLSVSHNMCGEKFTTKMNLEIERWARVVKATAFVADN